MRKFMPAIFLIILVSTVSGTSIGQEDVTVDLRDSTVEVELFVEELTSSSFSYITSYPVGDVEARIDGERTGCEVRDLQVGSEINCETSKRENFTVNLNFEGAGLVERQQGYSTFNYQHSVFRPTERFTLQVILPTGTGILRPQNQSTPVISPVDYTEGALGGRDIYIVWEEEPQLGDTLSFQAKFEELSDPQRFENIIIGAVAALIMILLSYVGWVRYTRQPLESVYGEIDEDEKEILELIQENSGQMLQKDIVKESDYSKAKISELVKELVELGVLTKEKEGRSNRLKVSKRYSG